MSSILVRADAPFRPKRPLRVPGDKSVAHRAVLLASVASGPSRIVGLPSGLDVASSLRCIRALGAATETVVAGERTVGVQPGISSPTETLDCGNSGTTMRLLCGLLAGRPVAATLDGDASLRGRPMRRVADPLNAMGARIATTEGHAPIDVQGSGLSGIDFTCEVASAQVKGALLLAGLTAAGDTTVRLPGPSRDHTERMLTALGVPVSIQGFAVTVSAAAVPGFELTVPGDMSSAAFLLGAAAATGGAVTIEGVGLNPTRVRVLEVLQGMGVDVEVEHTADELGEPKGTVHAKGPAVRPFRLGAEAVADAVDEIPLLCVLAACVEGTSEVAGAAELRQKESDRLATVAVMLRKFGVQVDEKPDGLVIGGRPQRLPAEPPRVDAAGDHRIALAAAVAGCGLGAVVVEGWEAAAVSYAEFAGDLQAGGVRVGRID